MTTKNNSYLNFISLNIGILMLSTSGVLGRPLQMDPEVAIFWRALLASFLLGGFVYFRKFSLKVHSSKDKKLIFLGGTLMAVHWVTYFYSLSLSNVAVALLTLHTFPAMTAVLEPLLLKTKFQFYHLLLATLVVLGVYIIAPTFDLGDDILKAIFFGLASAFTYALRNIYTRKVMPHYNGSVMMLLQLVIMIFLLSPFLFLKSSAALVTHDWLFILGLALLTTAIGHTLLVVNLKHYSAVTVSLISSIVPVVGIILGMIFLREIPTNKTIIGGGLIMISFIVEGYISNREK